MSKQMERWIYVSDMGGNGATVFNPETKAIRQINQAHVRDQAPCGLRLGVVEYDAGAGMYRETGEFAAPTDDLFAEMEDAYRQRNNWMYDWPHYQLTFSDDTAERENLIAILEKQMGQHPWKFEIIGLQKRHLMYFTDGNYNSQKKFVGLALRPGTSPYRRDGLLRRKFSPIWSSEDRDNKVPYPSEYESKIVGGKMTPLLYNGPAYVLRFKVDDQVIAHGHCNMYIMPDGTFIGSDWCQRHDYSSYSAGINLQMGIFTADAWITGSCVQNALSHGVFKPKSAKFEIADVRNLLEENELITVPTLDEAMETAEKKLAAEALKKGDPLKRKMQALLDATPDKPSGILAAELVAELEAQRAKNDITLLHGMPFFIKKQLVPEKHHEAMKPFLVTELVYGFTSQPGVECELGDHTGQICFEWRKGKPEHQHHHFHPSSLTLDTERAYKTLFERFESLRNPLPESTEDAGPITADVIAAANEVFDRLQLTRQLQQHADLIGDALRMATGLVPIEQEITLKKPDKVMEFGRARFTPHEDGDVTVEWLTGKYAFPEKKFRYRKTDKVTDEKTGTTERAYQRRSVLQPAATPVDIVKGSAMWFALEWYFVGRTAGEGQSSTAPDAAAGSTGGTVGNSTAPSVDGGNGLASTQPPKAFTVGGVPYVARIVNRLDEIVEISSPVTKDEAQIQRGKNGHPYLLVAGMRSQLAEGDFRDAVMHFWATVWPELEEVSTGSSTSTNTATATA